MWNLTFFLGEYYTVWLTSLCNDGIVRLNEYEIVRACKKLLTGSSFLTAYIIITPSESPTNYYNLHNLDIVLWDYPSLQHEK